MKILLTGAEGFTGHFFKKKAESAGHEVVTLKSDLTKKLDVDKEVSEVAPESVVHLAGISYVGHADISSFYEVNVIGTMNLLFALNNLSRKPSKILLASSANVYGNCDDSPIQENHQLLPVNHYAISKIAMEYMALTFLPKLPLIITRPFNYTGRGQSQQFLIPKLVDHFKKSSSSIQLGNTNVEREFNDVRMVCGAYLSLIEKGIPGEIYNICTGKPYSLNNILKILKAITGKSMDICINNELIRPNEIQRLYGNPLKLLSCTGNLNQFSIEETLNWMLGIDIDIDPKFS
ncbi:MAG: GDP-mannose 4,6-dehydratase [Cryomorphaceae bacterium]|jgi:nucleoside-diphosphate-sugar epimerase|nr:GDP-mannose 4,6-dehydratase [Cryomorphaceae bacterium]